MSDFSFAIIGFDLDGTLLDTQRDLGNAVNHALALAGRPAVPLADVRQLVGGGPRKMLERALALTGGMPGDDFAALYGELLAFYEANIAVHTCLYPGGEAMLDSLVAQGAQLAVVTNKLERLARLVLDELALTSRFAAVIGGDTLGPEREKPAPDLLEEMVRRLGGGRAAFVGDTTYDIRAARAASIPVVAVSFGFNDRPADQLGADAVIDHFSELLPALMQL